MAAVEVYVLRLEPLTNAPAAEHQRAEQAGIDGRVAEIAEQYGAKLDRDGRARVSRVRIRSGIACGGGCGRPRIARRPADERVGVRNPGQPTTLPHGTSTNSRALFLQRCVMSRTTMTTIRSTSNT
jgi:hypothetical protein